MIRTLKDGLEENYWKLNQNMAYHRAKLALYLWAWGCYDGTPDSILEIGPGATGGFLPLIMRARRRVGVDPNADVYRRDGFLTGPEFEGIEYVAEHFENWQTGETFDAIMCADALDHGEMGFHLLPKIAGLLKPGGRFYLHVHLRPADRLNESHDHALTEDHLDSVLTELNVSGVQLIGLRSEIFPEDIDNAFSVPALVWVAEKL